MPIIQLPDGNQAEFPDTMSNAEIETVLQKQYSSIAQPSEPDPITGRIASFVSGAADTTVDAISDMGTLAKNILLGGKKEQDLTHPVDKLVNTGMNYVKDKWAKVQELRNSPTQYEQKVAQEYPIAHALGSGTGYVIPTIVAANIATKPLMAPSQAITNAIIPKTMQGPIVNTATNMGLQGVAQGAIANPENPGQGAITGGITGAVVGGVLGAAAQKLQRAGDVQNFEKQNIADSGGDPNSYTGRLRINKELTNTGMDYAKNEALKNPTAGVKQTIQGISPEQDLNIMPAERVANLGKAKYAEVAQKVSDELSPFNNLQNKFDGTDFNATVASLPKSTGKILPTPLPEDPTFNQMWNYRKDLDKVKGFLEAKINARTATTTELTQYNTLKDIRNTLTQKMLDAADTLGMKDQFLNGEKIYVNELLPFNSFTTKSGKLISPEDVNDAMQRVNRVLMAKNPNFNQLSDISKSLGPKGKEIVGQAMLQRIYQDSIDAKGMIKPKTFYMKMQKLENSGVASNIWDPATRTAAAGIHKILDGADEASRLATPKEHLNFFQKLPSLLANPWGRSLLEKIGSSQTPQTQRRKLIIQLISGTFATGRSKAESSQENN